MTESSATPEDLDEYAAGAADQSPRLRSRAADLKVALDTFRASPGREDFVAVVAEVDIDVRVFGERWQDLGEWVGDVSQGFRDAGGRPGDEAVTVGDVLLDAAVGRYEPDEATVVVYPDRVVVHTGAGDDDISLRYGPDGEVTVVVNGSEYELEGVAAEDITIDAGEGDNNIDLAPGLLGISFPPGEITVVAGDGDNTIVGTWKDDTIRVGDGDNTIHTGPGDDTFVVGDGNNVIRTFDGDNTVVAGDGNNEIRTVGDGNNRIDVGDGNNTVTTGTGNDQITVGDGRNYIHTLDGFNQIDIGDGDNTVYGGDGTDVIDTGDGDNYVDGGAGNDRISLGEGHNTVSGGLGDDIITSGPGENVIYTGPGDDLILSTTANDTVYHEADDTVYGDAATVEVEIDLDLIADLIDPDASDRFRQRVTSDLVTLASSPVGQEMLRAIDDNTGGLFGSSLVISDEAPREGTVGTYGSGVVKYDVESQGSGGGPRPPIMTLHHELAHAYNDLTGTYIDGYYIGPDMPSSITTTDDNTSTTTTFDLDTDGDGRVSLDELDRDGDGEVDDDDLDLDGDGDIDFTPNRERQAVGLDVTPPDGGNYTSRSEHPIQNFEDHPDALTENGLREEMLSPRRNDHHRDRYSTAG